jgi:hypothetical protein
MALSGVHIVAVSHIRATRIPFAAGSDSQIHGTRVLAAARLREESTPSGESACWAAKIDASGLLVFVVVVVVVVMDTLLLFLVVMGTLDSF